ncbi:hypothetical protein ACGFZS_49500 [Streptomyces sp. NPDC048288]|uniref:hypothetical protein n=1 Tax=Streptomyces sp. NPDC048288 TaxID=3365529 RepID=UPI00371D8FA3
MDVRSALLTMTLRSSAAVSRRRPPNLGPSYRERPVAQARWEKAQELIEWLVAEGRIGITVSGDGEVAEWRRAVNYAKRHGLTRMVIAGAVSSYTACR